MTKQKSAKTAVRTSVTPKVARPPAAGRRPAGYSGTPTAKKLGIVSGTTVYLDDAPPDYADLIAPVPEGVTFQRRVAKTTDIVHVFCDRKSRLAAALRRHREAIKSDGVIWVSWPKKSSGVATDVTEDTIREVALPLGLVDVKVCAVNEVWSGLKLVLRKELR